MKKSLSKTEAEKQIKEFFGNVKDKTPEEVKKIKRLAMAYKIPLKDKRKLFCKKCLNPYKDAKIRMKKGVKSIRCSKCYHNSRWKIKLS